MISNKKTTTFFVTGTDTDVGKTICCKGLLQAATKQKFTTLAYKPIAAGCEVTEDGLRNEDALILQKNSTIQVSYDAVNPIAFLQPIAPHIAAEIENTPINKTQITQGLSRLMQLGSDLIIVEGAGGWRLPINKSETLSEWVVEQKIPVILVVGMKLGCLNHAILTYQSILNDGLRVAGWIANQVQNEMPYYQQNIDLLKHNIKAPMIAEIPYLKETYNTDLADFVDFDYK